MLDSCSIFLHLIGRVIYNCDPCRMNTEMPLQISVAMIGIEREIVIISISGIAFIQEVFAVLLIVVSGTALCRNCTLDDGACLLHVLRVCLDHLAFVDGLIVLDCGGRS